jgi:MFS family permease
MLSQSETRPRTRSEVAGPARRRGLVPRGTAFWLVASALTATMLGTTLPTPLYVLYEQQFGLATFMATVIFAVYAAGVLAALLVLGRASDSFGRRRVLLVALAFAALSAVAFLLADGVALLMVGRVLSGLAAGIFTGTATAALVDLAGAGQERRATMVATGSNMGGLGLGALLAGILAQFAPLPLRLTFWVDLGLVLLAIVAVWAVPETVAVPTHPRLRIRPPSVPPSVRPAFLRASIAGFAGFAVLGLFTAVTPSFLSGLLHEPSHALSGTVVFAVFAASALGQVALARPLAHRAMAAGCGALIAGMALLAAGLAATSLPFVVGAAVVAGLGQGLCMRAGLEAVTTRAPAEHRAGIASAFFTVLYVAIALPVIGEGLATAWLGLRTAGIAFTIAVATIAAVALATLVRGRPGVPAGATGPRPGSAGAVSREPDAS